MTNGSDLFPGFDRFLQDNPAWLDEAVPTEEASRITGVPACTLATWRSRGGGPPFLKLGGRTVRYQRRALFTWPPSLMSMERVPSVSNGMALPLW